MSELRERALDCARRLRQRAQKGGQGLSEMTIREKVVRAMSDSLHVDRAASGISDADDVFLAGFEEAADAVLAAIHDDLKARLQHDEEGVLEMLQGRPGLLE